MEKMPYQEISRSERLRPELAHVAIVEVAQPEPIVEGDWRKRALCTPQPDLFWPGRGGSTKKAREICAKCPVQEQCLEVQLAMPNYDDGGGIWAGTTESERRKMRKDRKLNSSDSDT